VKWAQSRFPGIETGRKNQRDLEKNVSRKKRKARGGANGADPVRGDRPELDLVRCLAFPFVFVHHILLLAQVGGAPAFSSPPGAAEPIRLLVAFRDACGTGVCLFFCLSADLTTNLLVEERAGAGVHFSAKVLHSPRSEDLAVYFFGIAIAIVRRERGQITQIVWFLLFLGNFHPENLNFPPGKPKRPLPAGMIYDHCLQRS
jgi:hypothetical protein